MFLHVILSMLVAVSLFRWVMWRRFGRRRFGRHFGHGFGGGRWPLLHAIRALGLDAKQRTHIKEMMIELRRLGTEMRFVRYDAREDLAAALGGETFDRARLESLAQKPQDAFLRARQAILDHLEALHASLTDEQRAKLRDLLGVPTPASDPTTDDHPYRGAV